MCHNFSRLSALLCACFCMLLASCNVSPYSSKANVDYRLLGRYQVTETGGYEMGWPGSGLALTFTGTSLTVTLTDGGSGIMDVSVNGMETPLFLKSGTHDYALVQSDTAKSFNVSLTRRTEVFDTGLFVIENVIVEGEVENVMPAARKILFLGDSITAGFGVRGETKDCQYNPVTNAPLQTYAGLTAKTFDADAHFIAISGRGVVHNWDNNPALVMPKQIDFALPDKGGEWSHANFVPDVIVTTLGTNDWSVINPGQDKFRQGYRDMLFDLRSRFPQAHIITANGPLLGGEKGAAIRDGIDWATADLSDLYISTLDFSLTNRGLIWSCNSHPGRDSMKHMSDQLSRHISAELGWKYNRKNLSAEINPPASMHPNGKIHFQKRVTEIQALPLQKGGVLLAGDSITEAWLWHKDKLPFNVSNHGVGWDTVEGLKARLPSLLQHSPEHIFIMIGTNDIGYNHSANHVATHVKDIIRAIQSNKPEAKIYLNAILPRESGVLNQVKAYNTALESVAEQTNIEFVDMTNAFATSEGTLKSELTDDGLHLNDKGYAVWAEFLTDIVKISSNPN